MIRVMFNNIFLEDGQGGSQNRRHFQRPPVHHKVDMRKYEKLISDIQVRIILHLSKYKILE